MFSNFINFDSLEDISGIEYKDVLDWLKASNIDVSIVRKTSTNQMIVLIGSKFGNIAEGFATKGKSKALKELVAGVRKTILEDGEKIINLPGSPSFMDIKRKKLLEKVTNELSKRGATVKLDESTNVPPRKTTVKEKTKTRTSTQDRKTGLTKGTGGRASPKRSRRGIASGPLQLIGLINKKLPGVVAKNMRAPRLQNQTGRFASSARIVDVTQTTQGFPSLGFTYEKNPYQVFESTSGTRYASVERDPRSLIEGSIREIAIELALGRIFTRRV